MFRSAAIVLALLLAACAATREGRSSASVTPNGEFDAHTFGPAFDSAPAFGLESDVPALWLSPLRSEWRSEQRCQDFEVRANSSYVPAWRRGHVLQNLPTEGFTVEVRRRLVNMGEAVASAVGGWRTDRHEHYPTTDFSLSEDFPPRYTRTIMDLARAYLLPHMAQLAGILLEDLVLEDLFIVKYEVASDGSSQQHLGPHRDGSTWTFSMGLNSRAEYEGGGTRLLEHGLGTFHSSPTTVLMHSGQILHEGLRISRGRRYLLVGFVWSRYDCAYGPNRR